MALTAKGASEGASASNLDVTAQIFKRLHPSTYLSRYLCSGLREDGRPGLTSFRDVSLALGTLESAHGSCLVRLGHTVLLAGLKGEIIPQPVPRDRGMILPSLDLGPMASPKFKAGPPGEEAQILVDAISKNLDSAPPLDLRQLCIEYGEAAWCLYIDIVCLSYDGNVLDAAMLGVAGAMCDARLPKAAWDDEARLAFCSPLAEDQEPLPLRSLALSSSFGIWEGEHLVSDPTSFEAALLTSSLSFSHVAPADAISGPALEERVELCGIDTSGRTTCTLSRSEAEALLPDEATQGLGVVTTEDGQGQEGEDKVALDDDKTMLLCIALARRRDAELRAKLRKAVADAAANGK